MPPVLENNYASPPKAWRQYVPRDSGSSSPGAVFYAASPGGSGNHAASKARRNRKINDALESLRAFPEVRSIPWREGKELPPGRSTESPRSQTRGAFLLSTRGQIRNPPCTHCATGVGRFSVCVSLDRWFHGACATCQMGTRGNLCSLRKEAQAGELASKVPPSKLAEPYVAQSPPLVDQDRPSSSLKRKRDSPSAITADGQPFMNSYPQAQTTFPPSNPVTSYALPRNDSPHSEASALLHYVYEKQYPPNGQKRHQVLHRINSSPRETVTTTTPTTPPRTTPRTAFAGQERHIPQVEPQRRVDSRSLSPSTQLIQTTHQHPPPYENQNPHHNTNNNNLAAAQPESRHVGGGHPATPLIDTLPRKKQKQIYQIIGGVQSGIRSVRQQTESLQKQLDLLQAALGIDNDDDDDDDDGEEDVEFVY